MRTSSYRKIVCILIVIVIFPGCASKRVTYTAVGTVAGAGVGYAINRDKKDTAIGGLVGAGGGYILGEAQEKKENKKYREGYEEGYAQAQVDSAVRSWNDATGKDSGRPDKSTVSKTVKIQGEFDGINYDRHYKTLEVLP